MFSKFLSLDTSSLISVNICDVDSFRLIVMATDADSPPQSANTTIDISIIVSVKKIDKFDACIFKYINQIDSKTRLTSYMFMYLFD